MDVIHRFFANRNRKFKAFLDRTGISYVYKEDIVGKTIFVLISESDPNWPALKQYAEDQDLFHTFEVKYSLEEIREAEWCELGAMSHFGYPQPEETYMSIVYDIRDYCDRCGIGGLQKKPFRFRSEPKQKNCHFFQLNWVFDEFFVRSKVCSVLRRNRVSGIGFRRALLNKTGEELGDLKQLVVKTVLPPSLVTDGLKRVTCKPDNEEGPERHGGGTPRYSVDYPYCGRLKYYFSQRLRFRRGAFSDAPDVVKSHEWFGSGGSAFRAVLVSHRVVELALREKWRGIALAPIQIVD